MLVLRIYSLGINVYIEKNPKTNTYDVISGDDEGHEGRLAEGITTIAELYKVLEAFEELSDRLQKHFKQEHSDV